MTDFAPRALSTASQPKPMYTQRIARRYTVTAAPSAVAGRLAQQAARKYHASTGPGQDGLTGRAIRAAWQGRQTEEEVRLFAI